jgi:hypothetical protein
MQGLSGGEPSARDPRPGRRIAGTAIVAVPSRGQMAFMVDETRTGSEQLAR